MLGKVVQGPKNTRLLDEFWCECHRIRSWSEIRHLGLRKSWKHSQGAKTCVSSLKFILLWYSWIFWSVRVPKTYPEVRFRSLGSENQENSLRGTKPVCLHWNSYLYGIVGYFGLSGSPTPILKWDFGVWVPEIRRTRSGGQNLCVFTEIHTSMV